MSITTILSSEEVQPENLPALQGRIEELQKVLRELEHMRRELAADIARLTSLKEAVDARTFESLMSGLDYSGDDVYEPSAEDEERLAAFNMRKAVDDRVSETRQKITELMGIQNGIGRKISSLEKALVPSPIRSIGGVMNRVLYSRLIDQIFGTRSRVQKQIANLKIEEDGAATDLRTEQEILAEVEEELAGISPTRAYDQELHMAPRKFLLGRGEQSILFSLERGRKKQIATFIIPATPTEKDFTVQVTLGLSKPDDIDDFQRFLGHDLVANNADFDLVSENIAWNGDVQPQLVPFPLEVVEIEGEDRLRLPQAFYDRFVSNIE